MLRKIKSPRRLNPRNHYKGVCGRQITRCVSAKTLPRFEVGLKLITTNNELPVLVQFDRLDIDNIEHDFIAYDLNNQKLYSKSSSGVKYFFKYPKQA